MQDIFIPQSSSDDALVGPLHTVTYITAAPDIVERMLTEGYALTGAGWRDLEADTKSYLGFDAEKPARVNCFTKHGVGANIQVRVIAVGDDAPIVRPEHLGLWDGGATISAPMTDMRAHEKLMNSLGIQSTIGVKEMDFTSPTGETYTTGEIAYMVPENVYMLGVTRPSIFVPTGPVDPEVGLGGPSYSARCISTSDQTIAFFREVLGYEIRRDVEFTVGEESALLMPEGTTERFIQGFAPGSQTGYLVFMDHLSGTKKSPVGNYGPPNRGIGMWTFETQDLDEVERRVAAHNCPVLQGRGLRESPGLSVGESMIVLDPDGFHIEIVAAG